MIERLLRTEEIALISWMIRDREEAGIIVPQLANLLVEEMDDGGMGSLRVVSDRDRFYARDLAEVELSDEDGLPLIISVNLDTDGCFFELDIWKVDYSPLIRFPSVPK